MFQLLSSPVTTTQFAIVWIIEKNIENIFFFYIREHKTTLFHLSILSTQ